MDNTICAGLRELNDTLARRTYLSGHALGPDDRHVLTQIRGHPALLAEGGSAALPHLSRWLRHCSAIMQGTEHQLASQCEGMPTEGHSGAAAENASEINVEVAFQEALASAKTKFDDLGVYFGRGMNVPAVAEMLAAEMSQDAELIPALEASGEGVLLPLVMRAVGMANTAWKRQNPGAQTAMKAKGKDIPLPWPSIEAYPEWVVNQIECYLYTVQEEPDQICVQRRALEHALLENTLQAASIKYDGTCFGKMNTGELVGRKQMHTGDEYQQTSVAATERCNVSGVREKLSALLGVEIESLCVWGELMCNPGYYNYKERGLDAQWCCFGVVSTITLDPSEYGCISEVLEAQGLAYSLTDRGRLRLMLCPALKKILEHSGACRVADDLLEGCTHAEMVARASSNLCAGENEGLVLVFRRTDGQSSIRKWKNSAEGSTVSQKHARLLRQCYGKCQKLASEGLLDARIVEMVATLISVAEAETSPMKIGRSKVRHTQ